MDTKGHAEAYGTRANDLKSAQINSMDTQSFVLVHACMHALGFAGLTARAWGWIGVD